MKYLPILLCLTACAPVPHSPAVADFLPIAACDSNNCGKRCWNVIHYRVDGSTETALQCALALPAHLDSDYALLRDFIEARYPHHSVVFVAEDETLLNPGAERTPVSTVEKAFKVKGLRLWMLRRSA